MADVCASIDNPDGGAPRLLRLVGCAVAKGKPSVAGGATVDCEGDDQVDGANECAEDGGGIGQGSLPWEELQHHLKGLCDPEVLKTRSTDLVAKRIKKRLEQLRKKGYTEVDAQQAAVATERSHVDMSVSLSGDRSDATTPSQPYRFVFGPVVAESSELLRHRAESTFHAASTSLGQMATCLSDGVSGVAELVAIPSIRSLSVSTRSTSTLSRSPGSRSPRSTREVSHQEEAMTEHSRGSRVGRRRSLPVPWCCARRAHKNHIPEKAPPIGDSEPPSAKI